MLDDRVAGRGGEQAAALARAEGRYREDYSPRGLIRRPLFGGTAEFVALAFKQAGRETWFFTYVTVVIAGSLAVYALMRDTRAHSRIAED